MKTIFKYAMISLFAVGMAAACSKKNAAGPEIQAAGSAGACPTVANLDVGQGASFALNNAAKTPAKVISLYKVSDPNKRDRSYYAMGFNGEEYVVFSDNKGEQGQPAVIGEDNLPQPPTDNKVQPGALKAGCVSNAFVVAGTDVEGQKVGLHIRLDKNNQGQQILKTDFGTYTRSGTPAPTLDAFLNSIKDSAKKLAGSLGVGNNNNPFVSGVPRTGDTK
jgi:hypothetical protein